MEAQRLNDRETGESGDMDISNGIPSTEESNRESDGTGVSVDDSSMVENREEESRTIREGSFYDPSTADNGEGTTAEMDIPSECNEKDTVSAEEEQNETDSNRKSQPMDKGECKKSNKKRCIESRGKTRVVLVGNPGAGKSTILSSIIGKQAFKSGISLGGGLTTDLKSIEHNGITYTDTPGLDDVLSRDRAGNEIGKALSDVAQLKVIFVVTLESQYVRSGDLVTMKLICNALSSAAGNVQSNFGLIINKCDTEIMESVEQHGSIRSHVLRPFRDLGVGLEERVLFIHAECEAKGKGNVLLSETQVHNINELVRSVPALNTSNKKVWLNLSSFEEDVENANTFLHGFKKRFRELLENSIAAAAKVLL